LAFWLAQVAYLAASTLVCVPSAKSANDYVSSVVDDANNSFFQNVTLTCRPYVELFRKTVHICWLPQRWFLKDV
jgi:hypothetical protein